MPSPPASSRLVPLCETRYTLRVDPSEALSGINRAAAKAEASTVEAAAWLVCPVAVVKRRTIADRWATEPEWSPAARTAPPLLHTHPHP